MFGFKKKKIKETKRYPYRGKTSNVSAWDSLSLIEKISIVVLPVALTFIDMMILDTAFGFIWQVSLIISILSTVILTGLIWVFAKWMTERD